LANKITETNLRSNQFVDAFSRYNGSEVIYWGDRNLLTFKTYKKRRYEPSGNDRYTVIKPGHEYRPDLVSYEAYGTPNFWWLIMEANEISDVYNFKAGTNLRIPARAF